MTDRYLEFKSAHEQGIVKVVANRGIAWQVQDDEGNLFLVQKKLVVRGPWEETEEATAEPLPTPSLASQLEAAAPKAASTPKADGANLITLKQLCFDLDIEPRIARRRLRNSPFGKVGIGSRWEWEAGSPTLGQVTAIILGTAPTKAE